MCLPDRHSAGDAESGTGLGDDDVVLLVLVGHVRIVDQDVGLEHALHALGLVLNLLDFMAAKADEKNLS